MHRLDPTDLPTRSVVMIVSVQRWPSPLDRSNTQIEQLEEPASQISRIGVQSSLVLYRDGRRQRTAVIHT